MNFAAISRTGLSKICKEIKIKGRAKMNKAAMEQAIVDAMDNDESLVEIVEPMAEAFVTEYPVKTKAENASRGITELTFNGKTQSLTDWAKEVGLNRPALYDRVNRHGWSVEEALTIPAGGRRKKAQVEGQTEMEIEE